MKRLFAGFLALLMTAGATSCASAQEYPNQPIDVVVGFGPGGSADAVARIISEEAKKILGVEMLVQNRPGASATVGVSAVMTARPDGYTIGATTDSPFLRAPHLLKLSFDPLRDTMPLVLYAYQRNFIVVNADSPFKSFQDLLNFATANPGKLTFGHPGVPTTLYLGFAGIANEKNIDFSNVAFSGDAQTMQSVLGGHVMAAGISAGPSVPQVKAGKIRILAIIDGTERMSEYSDVPTLSEFSKPENVIPSSGMLIFAPKGLPDPIAKKLEDTFSKAAHTSTFRNWGEENQVFTLDKPLIGTALRDHLALQNKRMGELIGRLGLRPK